MIGLILYTIAYILLLPLTIITYFYVDKKKGYFLNVAIELDIFANIQFRSLWNKILITKQGYRFGRERETISSVMGKNQRDNTLSKAGKILVWVLDKIEKDHCKNSIKD